MNSTTPTPQQMTDAFWEYMKASPGDAVFYKILGTAFASIIICSVWTNTILYYEYFGKTDRKWALGIIGLGCAIVTADLALDITQNENFDPLQVHQLAMHAHTDYLSVMKLDQTIDVVKALTATVLSFMANCFYGWRVYVLSGQRKIVLGLLVVISAGVYSYALFVSIFALNAPELDLSESDANKTYLDKIKTYYHASGGVTMAHDLGLCITMVALLWRSKTSLFNLEKRIYNKIAAITFESMLPPVICILITEFASWTPEGQVMSAYYGWHKILWPPLGPLYFQSLLMTLVSRKTLQRLLNEHLSSNGINRLGHASTSSGGRSTTEPVLMTVEKTSAVHPIEPRTVCINRDSHHDDIPMDSIDDVRLGGLWEKEPWKTSIRSVSTSGQSRTGNEPDRSSIRAWDVEAGLRVSRSSRDSDIPPFTGMFYPPGEAAEIPESRVHPFARSGQRKQR